MPSTTGALANLEQVGPIIDVQIGPSAALAQTLGAARAPQPHPAVAMIDTGASATVITPAIASALGLNPVGQASMLTPSTQPGQAPHLAYLYDVSIVFPGIGLLPSIRAIEAPLAGQHVQVLLGRNLLKLGVLVYIGYLNQFTLSF